MRRLWIGLGAIIVILLLVYSSLFVVTAREQAIVLRFGEINRVIQKSGIYFKLPTAFVDTVQFIDSRLMSFEIDDISVQVQDRRRYLVDAFVAFKIVDPRLFRENVSGSLAVAQDNLRARLDAALREVYGQRSFEAALSEQRGEMMVQVRDQLKPLAVTIGIDIVDVRIRRTELLPGTVPQTFDRMRSERLAEAAQLRARGTEQAARIRAEADRESVVTVAGAQREADIQRGQGEAERSRIFAAAFQADPAFFEFYRSMQAYETALNSDNTTFLLSPSSEFFRYFTEGGAGAAGTGAGGSAASGPRVGVMPPPAVATPEQVPPPTPAPSEGAAPVPPATSIGPIPGDGTTPPAQPQ